MELLFLPYGRSGTLRGKGLGPPITIRWYIVGVKTASAGIPPDLLRDWMATVPFPALVVDDDNTLVFSNASAQRLFSTLEVATDPFDPATLLDLPDLRVSGGKLSTQDSPYVAKKISLGGGLTFFLRMTRVRRTEGTFYCCVLVPNQVVDAVDYNRVFDTVGALVLQVCPSGTVGYLNDRLYTVLGYAPTTEGLPLGHLRELEADFDAATWRERATSANAGKEVSYRTTFRRADGNELPVEVTLLRDHLRDDGVLTLTALDASRSNLPGISSVTEEGDATSYAAAGLVVADAAHDKLLHRVRQVAPTDATVLIMGETGTGKEVLARYIHALSKRKDQPLVVVDCSSLPETLIESALFGHRKGAFTGAKEDHPGRFVQANGGTIFLDEIGELPLSMQTRLLRVLQERVVQPVGGQQPVPINVRILAATNRNLEQAVAAGTFRADLYFRLAVFPVTTLPLRDRPGDLLPLVWHFVHKFNKRLDRSVRHLDPSVLEKLRNYAFPGNVRELENLIERALITCTGDTLTGEQLQLPLQEPERAEASLRFITDQQQEPLPTLAGHQRAYIEHVLKLTDGKVSGKDGAAAILGINPQTLHSRMRKLGIR